MKLTVSDLVKALLKAHPVQTITVEVDGQPHIVKSVDVGGLGVVIQVERV